jgi:hypothetical protein
MNPRKVRIALNIPMAIYGKLNTLAVAKGCTVQKIILELFGASVPAGKLLRAKSVRFPLIVSSGPKVDLANERIYSVVEFP